MTDLETLLRKYHASVDENKRLHLQALCDGTFIFMDSMVSVLNLLGCTEIETAIEDAPEKAPKDKPWCSSLFKASGLLPADVVIAKKDERGDKYGLPIPEFAFTHCIFCRNDDCNFGGECEHRTENWTDAGGAEE